MDQHENPQILFSWKAPLRPYIKRSQEVLRFYIAVALLISVIIAFLGDRILLVPIWALLFIFYILTVTPPEELVHKITQFGIESAGGTYRYENLSHFYFTYRFGYYVLVVVTQAPYYHHLYLVIPDNYIKQKVTLLLSEHVVFQEVPQKTLMDRMVEAFSRLIPQDDVSLRAQTSPQTQQQQSPSPPEVVPTPEPPRQL